MTESMKRYLSLASNQIGTPVRNYNDHRTAIENGWVEWFGVMQNSTTVRYKITEKGRAALAAA